MSKIILYYNPDCSKCRQTLELVSHDSSGVHIVEYIDTQLSSKELTHIISLGIVAKDLIRTNEDEWKELGLEIDECTQEQLIEAILLSPSILQRPIVITNGKVVVARPPERVHDIL